MPRIRDVCGHVRSKNAGPFWVTFDLFFNSHENYLRYRDNEALSGNSFASLYGARADLVKRVPVDSLQMVKISYPRPHPQGWLHERDMHSGQLYVRLLDVSLV